VSPWRPSVTPGKPSKLRPAQLRRCRARLLLQGPRKHGNGTDLWTPASVAELIAANFGADYHRGHVWHLRKPRPSISSGNDSASVFHRRQLART